MLSRFSVPLYACLHHGITMHQYFFNTVHNSLLYLHCYGTVWFSWLVADFGLVQIPSKPAGGRLKHLVLAYLQKVPP